MTNKELKIMLVLTGIVITVLNGISILTINAWYPIAFFSGLISLVGGLFISGKEHKKKRKPTLDEIEKLSFNLSSLKNKQLNILEFVCDWTGINFTGIPVTYSDYINDNNYELTSSDILGQICINCQKISHKKSKDSGFRFSQWSGYEKAKCSSCKNDEIEPIVILNH